MNKWFQAAVRILGGEEPIIYEKVKTDSLDLATLEPQELQEVGKFLDVLVVRFVSSADKEYFVRHAHRGIIQFDGTTPVDKPEYNAVLAIVKEAVGGTILPTEDEIQLGSKSYLRFKISRDPSLSMIGIARAVTGYKSRVYKETPSPEKPIKHVDKPSAVFSNVPEDIYNKYCQRLNLTEEK